MDKSFGKLELEGDEVDLLPNLPSETNESKFESDTPISDMLDKLCPYYMMLGVSYDEFWNGDGSRLKYYVEKHKLEIEKRNQELWLQGLYNYEALVVALANAFSKKSAPPRQYPEKPFRLFPPSEEEKELEKKKMVDDFRAQLMMLDRKFTQKHGKDKG